MAHKLAIANVVVVPVKFTVNDAGKSKEFSFSLTCDRLEQDQMTSTMKDEEKTIVEFLMGITKGWSGQKLVVDDEGNPADFSQETLQIMLSVTSLPLVIFRAYCKECGAKEKN